jgi:hypothetical protein
LGVALAVHGRRAIRARMLNAASAGGSVFMNVIAAAPGWRNLAVWAMPPAMYALASDTLIGVVHTGAVASRNSEAPGGGAAGFSFLAALGGLALWLLRLSVAPRSTAAGFRQWVLEECPVAPGRRAPAPAGASVPGRPGDGRPGHRTTAGRTRPRQPGRARQIATRAGGLTRPSGGLHGSARRRLWGSWRSRLGPASWDCSSSCVYAGERADGGCARCARPRLERGTYRLGGGDAISRC